MSLRFLSKKSTSASIGEEDKLGPLDTMPENLRARRQRNRRLYPRQKSVSDGVAAMVAAATQPSVKKDNAESCNMTTETLLCQVAKLVESLSVAQKFDEVLKVVMESSEEDWTKKQYGNDAGPSASCGGDYNTTGWTKTKYITTPLHVIVAHDPPVTIIDKMISILREKFGVRIPEEFQDEDGRTPLHVAVAAGCSVEVAERLLSGESLLMPALMKDSMGRTPLHWACARRIPKPKSLFTGHHQYATVLFLQRKVLDVLLEHYPEACCVVDARGTTPLDYARDSELAKSQSAMKSLETQFLKFAPKDMKKKEKEKKTPKRGAKNRVKQLTEETLPFEGSCCASSAASDLDSWLPSHTPGCPSDNVSSVGSKDAFIDY